jgi:hypothetical protein
MIGALFKTFFNPKLNLLKLLIKTIKLRSKPSVCLKLRVIVKIQDGIVPKENNNKKLKFLAQPMMT